jgi:hypothetical protein
MERLIFTIFVIAILFLSTTSVYSIIGGPCVALPDDMFCEIVLGGSECFWSQSSWGNCGVGDDWDTVGDCSQSRCFKDGVYVLVECICE